MASSSKSKSPKDSNQALSNRIDAVEETLKSLLEAVDKLNSEAKTPQPPKKEENKGTASKPAKSSSPSKAKNASPKASAKASKKANPTLLEAINDLPIPDLIEKLKSAGAKQHIVRNIVNQRKRSAFQKFTSLDDLIKRIKGLAKPTLDIILEQWS